MSKPKVTLQDSLYKLKSKLGFLKKDALLFFVIFVATIYGFVLYRINILGNQEPSETAVSSQVQTANVPRIDQSLVTKVESLQDNSVSVKTLFDQERSNPFSN